MSSSFKYFFTEGVFPALRTTVDSKPFRASLAGVGCFFVPGAESVAIFRAVAHESAHGLEGLRNGATVESIDIEYNLFMINGKTALDNTTPESAVKISLAGLGCDVGFLICSVILLKKLSPIHAVMFAVYDIISFFLGQDFTVYKLAKEYMKGKKT